MAGVLIVDDEPALLLFMRKAVERCGFTVITAANRREAEVAIRTSSFACALLDKNLPDGNGLDLLQLLRKEKPDADVIIVTGYVNSQSAIEALRMGAVDYLCKPLDLETIGHRVTTVIERRKAREERGKLELMLVHSNRLSSLGTMAAGVVHELNAPLTVATCGLSFLSKELTALVGTVPAGVAERLRSCLEAAEDASAGIRRAATIVKDLRTFSRKDESPGEAASLEECVEASLSLAGAILRPVAKVEKKYGESPPVSCSATRLEQVILNLLVNAAQAISASGEGQGLITVTVGTAAGGGLVEIADNGAGMSADVQRRLFEPFFTTKPKAEGTGLGLSVCQGIVTGAGGTMEVRSEPGKGSTFRLAFPPPHGPPSAPPPMAPSEHP